MTNTITFRFPQSDDEDFQYVRDVDDLKQKIVKKGKYSHGYAIERMYRCKNWSGRYLYAQCKAPYCGAVLKYHKDNHTRFKLSQAKRLHIHKTTKSSVAQAIQKFMRQHSNSLSPNDMKKYMINKFFLTDKAFYYYYKKFVQEASGIKSLLLSLRGEQHYVDTVPDLNKIQDSQDQVPQTTIIVTSAMKQCYQKFGQFVDFEMNYNIFKEVKVNQQSNLGLNNQARWGLGIFFGRNNHNKVQPFGIVITKQQNNSQAFAYIFGIFFRIMEKPPQVITTNLDKHFELALRNLRQNNYWSGAHLYDVSHVLKNILYKIKDNKNIFENLRKSIYAQKHSAFVSYIKQARSFIINEAESKVVDQFVANSDRYCISQTPAQFAGISDPTSFSQKKSELIKKLLPYQNKCYSGISKIIKWLQDLHSKSSYFKIGRKQQLEQFKDHVLLLDTVRNSVSEKVMEMFLKKFASSLQLSVKDHNITQEKIQFEDKLQNFVYQVYQVVYNIRNDKWQCSCMQEKKTGLPCIHQIKTCQIKGSDLINYIHPRWHITLEEKQAQQLRVASMMQRGRPKRTGRRNMNH